MKEKIKINTIIQGDCLEVMKTFPDNSVDLVVTSPPYWGLRDYGTAKWEGGDVNCDHRIDRANRTITEKTKIDVSKKMSVSGEFVVNGGICPKCGAKRIDEQLGLEKTPEEYVSKMVEVFREVKRVLKKEGTCWLNLGDSYTSTAQGTVNTVDDYVGKGTGVSRANYRPITGLKSKDLVGIPWRVAFALQADGWYLRQDIIWHKPNPMPESVTDRCTKSHEYIFLLAKSPKYYFDNEAIKENSVDPESYTGRRKRNAPTMAKYDIKNLKNAGSILEDGTLKSGMVYEKRNRRSVWTITTKPFKEAHFATFPEDLIRPMILAGCPEKGIVLDPFIGSGTTAVVTQKLGRNYLGIELNPDYIKMAEQRLLQEVLF
jgi:DNA modification methylase